jgi:hypothetical protein
MDGRKTQHRGGLSLGDFSLAKQREVTRARGMRAEKDRDVKRSGAMTCGLPTDKARGQPNLSCGARRQDMDVESSGNRVGLLPDQVRDQRNLHGWRCLARGERINFPATSSTAPAARGR